MNTSLLVFDGPGVYEPVIEVTDVQWWRNNDGDPFVGVQVNSLAHAATFATVITLEELLAHCSGIIAMDFSAAQPAEMAA